MNYAIMGVMGLLLVQASQGAELLLRTVAMPTKDVIKSRLEPFNLPPQPKEEIPLFHRLSDAKFLGDVLAAISVYAADSNVNVGRSPVIPEEYKKMAAAHLEAQVSSVLHEVLKDQPGLLEEIQKDPLLKRWHKKQPSSFTNGQI